MSFKALGLSEELLSAVAEQGYNEPTPIQQQAIPIILAGSDVLAGAQTGTGKTAGFTLPLLDRLMARYKAGTGHFIRALILTPTRELAAQVGESVETYGKNLPLKSAVIFGGVNIKSQVKLLGHGVDILIATPGRLLDLVSQGIVDLKRVEILVLDEADRMLDMGFIPDIRKILAIVPKNRQNLLFSATFSPEIKKLADGFLKSPKLIEVARQNATADRISQVVHLVDNKRKSELLGTLIASNNWKQVLVFTRTKHGANRLAQFLVDKSISASAIHGNKSQSARTKALADFKQGAVRVLVATDIAARGLDIDQLPHVVNYELPNVPEDYVHRIGRTGRAGCEGEAVSLVCIDEHGLLRDIERLLKTRIDQVVIPGFEPNPAIKAEPIPCGRMGGGGGAPRSPRGPSTRSGNSNPPRSAPQSRPSSSQSHQGSSQGSPQGSPRGESSRSAPPRGASSHSSPRQSSSTGSPRPPRDSSNRNSPGRTQSTGYPPRGSNKGF